ncbi:MAG: hypothetical protein UU93_C0003G0045 [Candidatus Amesbacteria bacterium GW2011_GWA2_42_12]|uniref:Uncharacterized protein n=1 Tax=Candidatus Amesbacteria bacterium GW2011_GWA2_42_12 TaxID=1618356 RepID=A0A0G0Y8F9_9BACT|nr:MAG: hypothetical protein UU93_C0003G0045 [Candidatus Amesbacteria bacterium GW2011_GWA2_42_12]
MNDGRSVEQKTNVVKDERWDRLVEKIRGLGKSEKKQYTQSPLEKVADAVRTLVRPTKHDLYASSIGFALVPEAILSIWESYGKDWITLYYKNNEGAFTASPETVNVVRDQVAVLANDCTTFLSNGLPNYNGVDVAISGIGNVGSFLERFRGVYGSIRDLSPSQVSAICHDVSQLGELDLINKQIIPEIQRNVLQNLNLGFESMRFAGIFMTAYSIFSDKINSALIPSEAGKLEKGLLYAFTNLSLAYSALLTNAMLTFIHTGGFFHESMVNNLPLAVISAGVMTLTKISAEELFNKRKNRNFVEFIAGASTVVAITGPSTLTALKFILGLTAS